jgi:hypothetical protein
MKVIYKLLIPTLFIFLFNACNNSDGKFNTENGQIEIVTCTNGTTTIEENDLLVKGTNNTNVKITHNTSGSKEICIISGDAHLIRGTN